MIEIKIRFWANNLADGKGGIRTKHLEWSKYGVEAMLFEGLSDQN